jgi:hypothetical protein
MNTTTLKTLNTLVEKLNITEDTFYSTTLGRGTIGLQGHMNAETFEIARALEVPLEAHPTNAWFEGNVFYDDINIRMCLTIG